MTPGFGVDTGGASPPSPRAQAPPDAWPVTGIAAGVPWLGDGPRIGPVAAASRADDGAEAAPAPPPPALREPAAAAASARPPSSLCCCPSSPSSLLASRPPPPHPPPPGPDGPAELGPGPGRRAS